jgi:predicted site-specific integrase-resolvase
MPKRLLNVDEVGAILGKEPKTVQGYCTSGYLNIAFKIGNEWRIPEDELWEIWVPRIRTKRNSRTLQVAR